MLWTVNWHALFVLHISVLELFLRGTAMYLAVFVLLRVIPNRQAGTVGTTNVLVIILVATAAGSAMTGGNISLTGGLVLVGTIIFWSVALDWLAYGFPVLQRVLRTPSVVLVQNGRMNRWNMRMELMTEEELMTELRQHGIEKLAEVKAAYMEANGEVSVIRR
jgi:uncharacterized membrane protein YcaP (DUF421 family)